MTTAQPMLCSVRRGLARTVLVCLLAALALPACESSRRNKKYVMPAELSTPYPPGREVVLAVAPLRNESGVSLVDELSLTDTLVNEMQQASGVTVLPLNRTLAAMRALNLPQVDTPADALALAKAAGADGLVVGTVTAWDPYDPPALGLSLAVFGRGPLMRAPDAATIDPSALRSARSEAQSGAELRSIGALSVVSDTLDASSGATRERVRIYAQGRHDPDSPRGWQRYLVSMGLYAKFACFEMSRRLFDAERQRLGTLEGRGSEAHPR